ncbi:hypothetical protein FIV00_09075 [Labrenzia sp. THAF82]|nr:hypothetical protein FIV00_09075 [Labrenzia sp. THAF82]
MTLGFVNAVVWGKFGQDQICSNTSAPKSRGFAVAGGSICQAFSRQPCKPHISNPGRGVNLPMIVGSKKFLEGM